MRLVSNKDGIKPESARSSLERVCCCCWVQSICVDLTLDPTNELQCGSWLSFSFSSTSSCHTFPVVGIKNILQGLLCGSFGHKGKIQHKNLAYIGFETFQKHTKKKSLFFRSLYDCRPALIRIPFSSILMYLDLLIFQENLYILLE